MGNIVTILDRRNVQSQVSIPLSLPRKEKPFQYFHYENNKTGIAYAHSYCQPYTIYITDI